MISAVIITKNEEKHIEECLESINWCDEVIVIDTGNTDKTNAIAKKHNAKIFQYKGSGSFNDWRNFALRFAQGKDNWIFYIDADERSSKSLQEEILYRTEHENENAYAVPRRNFIFGKEFKHSGQYPDYQKRLFKKSALKRWVGEVHEEPEFEGELGHLENSLIHKKDMTLAEMVAKTNKWSEIEARLMFDSKHPKMTVPRFFTAMAREFWKRMVLEMAFLDGKEGVVYAVYQVFSKFTSYAKLYEMQIKN